MGLHLGWIPNEPGLRSRVYDRAAPREPEPDPAKVAALAAAQHARGMWARLLVVTGLFAVILFVPLAAFAHARWAWGAAGGLALCCWLPVLLLGRKRRRAEAHLREETERGAWLHATELEEYEEGKALWARSEQERIATAPRWLQVAAHEDMSRLDVFGGTVQGRQNMVTGLGWELLAERAVIVLDLSQDKVADGLLDAAARAGLSWQDYQLPRDLNATPLLAGLGGEQIASLIVEVVHADDAGATAAGRATDLMILRKVIGVLGGDVTMGRLHAALGVLLSDGEERADPAAVLTLTQDERVGLRGLFGDGFRHQVAGNLVRLAAVVEPLSGVGAEQEPRQPSRLTVLSLADGPRDVAADLTAALVVQWVTRAVAEDGGTGAAAGGGFRPAVILAGADEQSVRHLARLTAVCERYDIPLVRAFSRLTEESARHLDTRHTAFLRLATRPEALRAAEHIGLERRFVAGRFSHRHSVSRSRTRTTGESVTHTTGRTEGEAVTHTTGTTTGQAYSEAEVPRQQQQQVNVHVENRRPREDNRSHEERRPDRAQEPGQRPAAGEREPSRAGSGGGRGGGGRGGGNRGGGGAGDSSVKVSVGGKHGGRPQTDIMKTHTKFTAQHESEAKTQSWTRTEETSHTTTTSQSRTDGVSVGDEIGYELVYDHKVHPETLMALPEDQMLAPHIVESRAVPGTAGGVPVTAGAQDSKMVALVIDPAIVGGEQVAPVRPGEIPVFEPPAPAVSGHVPDYKGVAKPALGAAD
jgi:uncharacterized membrane protein YgcG